MTLTQPSSPQACIDQNNVDQALLCLPVFLASCKGMLCVAGESYTKRLWCVVEVSNPRPAALSLSCPLTHATHAAQVFVFLQMGGNPRNITVVPIGTERASVDAVKASFREFCGEKAECFLAADRHKLLGVIEASFGDFRKFDRLVRNVFEARRLSVVQTETPPVSVEVRG